jgi:predicted DNA-binding helix-hairpin-helix protein
MNSGDKLHINVCSFDDLLGLPSVGKATAYKIWELRKSTEITPEILATISHLKMEKVLPLIDFSTSQEGVHLCTGINHLLILHGCIGT